jgi:hypothetical protein
MHVSTSHGYYDTAVIIIVIAYRQPIRQMLKRQSRAMGWRPL